MELLEASQNLAFAVVSRDELAAAAAMMMERWDIARSHFVLESEVVCDSL